jgi:hypothetical protein
MKTISVLVVVVLISLASAAGAQDVREAESVFSDYLNVQPPGGFLHVPGLDFNTSMGFSYLSSSGCGSVGMGYYLGHFSLQLSQTLTVRWDVGIQSELTGRYEGQQPQLILPNVDLTYRPNDTMTFRIQYRQYNHPSYYLYRR